MIADEAPRISRDKLEAEWRAVCESSPDDASGLLARRSMSRYLESLLGEFNKPLFSSNSWMRPLSCSMHLLADKTRRHHLLAELLSILVTIPNNAPFPSRSARPLWEQELRRLPLGARICRLCSSASRQPTLFDWIHHTPRWAEATIFGRSGRNKGCLTEVCLALYCNE